MEFLTSIFPWTVDIMVKTVNHLLNYLVSYRDHVKKLCDRTVELGATRECVQNDIEAASRNLQNADAVAFTIWRDKVDEMIAKAKKEILLEDQAKMMCCNGWCLNLIFRYRFAKNACQIESDLQKIHSECPLRNNNVGYDGPKRGMVAALSTRGYEDFTSRDAVWKGVMGALKEDKMTSIGVFGMAGSGKTTLVKRVAEEALKAGLFDEVIVTVVSQRPNFKNIQDQIAQKLGRKHVGVNQDVIADWLNERLRAEKKILIIVDDIWKRSELDLNALGISFGNDQNGCKLLLTSRDQSVLKNDMNIEEKNTFLVDRLKDDEAKKLFQKIVGSESESEYQKWINEFVEECGVGRVSEPENKKMVDKIVEECGGLPLAITTVAKALKKRRRIHWSGAVQMSKPLGMERLRDPVSSAIKLSYDFLESEEEQSLFLLCSLHAEDQEINIENLLRYGVGYVQDDIYDVGLGMFRGVYKMEEARTRLNESIESLKDCFLLLDGNDGGTIKMHDVTRDVAIKIAREKYLFIVKEALELEGRSKSKDVIAFSLPDGYDYELPERLVCPQLKLFLLSNNKNSLQIPNRFFEETKELNVLSLNGMCLPSLRDLLLQVQNLQTLCLVGCKLDNVDNVVVIGELKELKVLSLAWSNIERLPKEIGNLSRLQLLDLGNCFQLEVIEPDVLSKLKRLNELYIENSFNKWEVEGQNTGGSNARVSELDHLSRLTTLNIHIPNGRILPNALCFKNLVRYKILIGKNWDWTGFGSEISTLKINIDGRFLIDDGIKRVLKKCEALCLGEIGGVKKILYKDCDGFPKLKYLDIKNNTEIQHIISSGGREHAFPRLESMSLINMVKLEKIFDRDHAKGFSCNLRKVNVEGCDRLKYVFHLSMIQSLSQLQEMVIHRCKEMKAVVAEYEDDSKMEFTELRILELRSLPKLNFFSFDFDSEPSNPRPLFNKKDAFPMLETLNIYQMDLLKMIWPEQLKLDSFSKLKKLYITQCGNLIEIFQPNTLRSIRSLEELRISDCQLTEVFAMRGTNEEETGDTIQKKCLQLKYLDLQNLGNLKYIWSLDRGAIFTFKNLHEVKVGGCCSLKSLFPASVARDLEHLTALEIYQCGVEEVVGKDEGLETEPTFSFPRLTLLRLEQLPELQSFYPGKHWSKWPSLKELKICNCDKLEIFGSEDPSQQTLIFIEKHTFPNVEELILEWGATLNRTNDGGFPIEFFCKLRFLELNGAPFEEICRHVSEEEEHPGTLEHLTRLKLCKMPRLKHIWKENSQPSRSFKLQKLEISECDGLETFVPSSISFQNLRKLKVSKCQGLISLLTSTTAKSLLCLKKMEIFECKKMTDIVSNEGSEAGDEITFNQLKSLVLRSLRSLTSFNSGNCKIIFPSLEKLTVIQCPQLENFSNGVISAPMLKGVKLAK